ncbi:MAG: 1-deoxy-D-xylulose-5-phosphate reductoisomerase [Acidobacteria bacterium]|nr:1-deoxy-D-xylulose-5-phosphate reductoisomerase [Acidobacteriota bacterium]
MRRIAILGSTGSIGHSALAVVAAQAGRLEVVGLAAGRNAGRFAEQVKRFRPRAIAMATPEALCDVQAALGAGGSTVDSACAGPEGLLAVATHPDVDLVLCASSGTAALDATLAAIEAGKTVALANKEVLVMAGGVMMTAARRRGVAILPVDSEHNAIHQCLRGHDPADVRRLILTASGGPFRTHAAADLAAVTPEEALDHPTWNMGPKITIDSATLMNKGLEVIEARWLFDTPPERIDVVVHPQSIVHSLVELCDGSLIAQLGVTDMQLPIQYAFSYPDRWESPLPPLDLVRSGRLEFDRPDVSRFPCLAHAYHALRGPASLPIILNAANELAVAAFLARRMPFDGIPAVIEQALDAGERLATGGVETLAAVREVDAWARRQTAELVSKVESS